MRTTTFFLYIGIMGLSSLIYSESFVGSVILRNRVFKDEVSVSGSLNAHNVVFSCLSVSGGAQLREVKVSRLAMSGGLQAEGSSFESVDVSGGVHLNDVTITGLTHISGGIQASKLQGGVLKVKGGLELKDSIVRSIEVQASKVIIDESKVADDLVVPPAYDQQSHWWWPFSWSSNTPTVSEVFLKDTEIGGSIIFQGAPGIVYVRGSNVPKVCNGTIKKLS